MKCVAWLFSFLLLVTFSTSAQDPQGGGRRARGFGREMNRSRMVGPLLTTSADKDHNGTLTTEEWKSFVDSLQPNEAGAINADLLKKLIFVGLLDRDQDGALETTDLEMIFAELDKKCLQLWQGHTH